MYRFIFLFALLTPLMMSANNIQIANISLSDQDVGANTIMINFDLSWENSWRLNAGPSNWDAAWIFIKYRVPGKRWKHVYLNYNNGTNDGHSAPTGATINTASDQTGCFIYRSSVGSGHVTYNGVQLLWDYGAENLDEDQNLDIKVFGIEMVYVPQAPFYVGNGLNSDEVNRIYEASILKPAFHVSSEAEIIVGNNNGELDYHPDTPEGGDRQGPIPAAFPKGYDAFYCMKYETSQGQYVDFFNTLSETQKINHDLSDLDHKTSDDVMARNGFSWESGYATTSLPDIPVNFVANLDISAYLDWSGLRPLTEMEFVKACRGTLDPVPNEFAWGNNEINSANYILQNEGTPQEIISNLASEGGVANLSSVANLILGPARCGVFAASSIVSSRANTGGTYYGIMEMSGNLFERFISIGSPEGRAFDGSHGDGALANSGYHDVITWPAPVSNSKGYGLYGGGYGMGSNGLAKISARVDAKSGSNYIDAGDGFRGGRTAE